MDMRVDERGKFFTARIAKDAVAAFVRTRDQVIVGSMYVRPGHRLTDELNSDVAPFLALTDAQVFRASDEALLYRAGLLMVAYREIVLIGELAALAAVRSAPWQLAQHEPNPRTPAPELRINEKGKFFSARVPKDAMPVMVSMADMLATGAIHLRPERRLRDELHEAKSRFLPITEPRVYDAAGATLLYHAGFLLAAYEHIALVSPIDSLSDARHAGWLADIATKEQS